MEAYIKLAVQRRWGVTPSDEAADSYFECMVFAFS